MKLLYFAWVRAKIGLAEENVEPPSGVTTVGDLLDWLCSRGPNFAAALSNRQLVKVAVNQEYAALDWAIKPSDEIAVFPPVTGG